MSLVADDLRAISGTEVLGGKGTSMTFVEEALELVGAGKPLPPREVGANGQPARNAWNAALCAQPASQPRCAELEEAIKRRIAQRTARRIQLLDVEASGTTIVIRGRAACYYLKQLALQGALEALVAADTMEIELNIEVVWPPERDRVGA